MSDPLNALSWPSYWHMAEPAAKAPVLETDEALRARLIYIAGESPEAKFRLKSAGTVQLDEVAEELGLRRLKDGK